MGRRRWGVEGGPGTPNGGKGASALPSVGLSSDQDAVYTRLTVASLQAGLYYGALGMIDGMIDRLLESLGPETKVVATGGQARGSALLMPWRPNRMRDGGQPSRRRSLALCGELDFAAVHGPRAHALAGAPAAPSR